MIYEYVFSEIVQTSEKKCLCVDPFLKLYEERRFFLLDSMQRSKGLFLCVATIEKAIILFC